MTVAQLLLYPAAKKAESKESARVPVPNVLRPLFRRAVAASALQRLAKGRVATFVDQAKNHLLDWWAHEFARTGEAPNMATFTGEGAEAGFVVVKRASFNAEKAEAFKEMGVDVSPYVSPQSLEVNISELPQKKIEAIVAALDAILTDGEADKAITVKHQLDACAFVRNLPGMSEDLMGTDEPSAEGIRKLAETAGLQQQFRNAKVDGARETELLSIIDGCGSDE